MDRLKMQEDTILGEQQGDVNFHEQNEEERAAETIEGIQAINEIKELVASEEADKNITEFLRMKGLSDDIVKTLINVDLTDEYIRLALVK